ncbi:hypothetical protein A0H81_04832 [Grifola frondosa]|uniref:F-box domain-containing protein n=1 Tax=Grifola frondosa TaxID=5627 RepID=A0A1C7MEA3_GRIFR|nr:hypothetical protein A0H81_04832 [Grifola frondosa]
MYKPQVSAASRVNRPRPTRKQKLEADRKKGKRPNRNAGKLAHLLNMPMDIFFEVASKLTPLDILHLSRVSKGFRAILISKTAQHIWIAARRNIQPQFPDCPPNLSELQYISLIFEQHCQACGIQRAPKVDYALGIRLCGPCWKTNVKQGKTLKKQFKNIDDKIFTLLPVADPNADDVDILDHDMHDLYYEPEFSAIAKQYLALLSDKEGLAQFVDVQRDAVDKRQLMTYCSIKAKLAELGYTTEEYPLYEREWNKIMYQSRDLTPTTWKTIPQAGEDIARKPEVQNSCCILGQMACTSRTDDGVIWSLPFCGRRNSSQTHSAIFKDAIELPSLAALLIADEPDKDISPEQFSATVDSFLLDAETFAMTVKQDLVGLMYNGDLKADEDPDDIRRLDGPAALFTCSQLFHRSILSASTLMEHWQAKHPSECWSADKVHRHYVNEKYVQQLVEALGFSENISINVVADLVDSGTSVACSCGEILTRPIGRWQHNLLAIALRHVETHNRNSQSVKQPALRVKILGPSETDDAQARRRDSAEAEGTILSTTVSNTPEISNVSASTIR